MSKESRIFYLPEVLSVSAGPLLCEYTRVKDLVCFLVGEDLFSHQMVRALKFCGPQLIKIYPCLGDVDPSTCTPHNWQEWLTEWSKKLPAEYTLYRLDGWERRDPFQEAEEIFGRGNVAFVIKH